MRFGLKSSFQQIKRACSRTHWVVHLLNLSKEPERECTGVLMLQIDGLSRKQFERALTAGNLPFLRKRMQRDHFRLISFYSGLPSTTPAVEAELYYGQQCAVPAFSWYDRTDQKMRRMFEPGTAKKISSQLGGSHPPLLEGGASYANIYSGGAKRSQFCWETLFPLDWKSLRGSWSYFAVGILHFPSFLRTAGLMIWEILHAIGGLISGVMKGCNGLKELNFVFTRIAMGLFTRESIRYQVKTDIERGVGIIHANFMSYDENAHRRSPSSHFAPHSPKGAFRCTSCHLPRHPGC